MSPQLISHLALHEPTSSQLISVTSSSSKTTCPLFIYLGTLHAHPVLLHLMSIHLISHLIFSCQTSLKNCKLKMWKQSFRARLPSKKQKVEDVETKLFLPSKPESWRCENVQDIHHFFCSSCAKRRLKRQFHWGADPTMIPVQPRLPRNRRAANLPHPSSETRFVLQNTAFRAPAILRPHFVQDLAKSVSGRCENEAVARDDPQRPSKSESGRCESKAFVRDIPQNLKAEDVKTKLSCEASLKN